MFPTQNTIYNLLLLAEIPKLFHSFTYQPQSNHHKSKTMNTNLCNLHFLPLNQICGLDPCSFIMCSVCFLDHQKQTHHSYAVLLNESTLNFFVDFLYFITDKLEQLITIINSVGFNGIFKTNLAIQNYWDSKNIVRQIVKHALEILHSYKTLMYNNRRFVLQNRHIYTNLFHVQFFRDIYSLIINKWSINADKLISEFQQTLRKNYPNRYIYKNLKFQLVRGILGQIQQKRSQMINEARQRMVQEHKELSKISDLKISNVQSQIEERCGPIQLEKEMKFTKTVDSFYQILQNSQASLQKCGQQKPILSQIPQSIISPNFLTFKQLQKHVQQLLIENQRLKIMNNELQNENKSLKEQNERLKYKKIKP